MQPKKIWANLAVKDIATTLQFYTALGFKPNKGDNNGKELASILFGENDFVINFFQKDDENFKRSVQGPLADPKQGTEVMFTLWAESKEEANTWAEQVRNAGGTIFSEPAEFGDGYYGFGFADPDGHKWNVFHM